MKSFPSKTHPAKQRESSLGAARKGLRLLVWTVLGILVALFAVVVLLHLPFVQGFLLDQAARHWGDRIPVGARLEGFRWRPFSGLRLEGLRLESSGVEFLRCREADLSYFFSLDAPYFHPVELVLDHPELRLEKDDKGRWKLPGGEGPSPSRANGGKIPLPPPSVPLPRLRLLSASIEARQNGERVLSIRNVDGTLTFKTVEGADGPSLGIDLGWWQGFWEAPRWGLCRLTGKIRAREEQLLVDRLEARLARETRLSLQGRWTPGAWDEGSLRLELSPLAWKRFPELREAFPHLDEISGVLQLEAREGVWDLHHDLTSPRGAVKGRLTLKEPLSPKPALQWTGVFEDLRAPVPGAEDEPRLTGSLNLDLQGGDLKTLDARWKAYVASAEWRGESINRTEISGSLEDGLLTLRTEKASSSLGDFSLDLRADLQGFWDEGHAGEIHGALAVEEASLQKVFAGARQSVKGKARFDGRYPPGGLRRWREWSGEVEVDLDAPRFLSIQASGEIRRELVDLQYDVEVEDLEKLSAFIPGWQGAGRLDSRGTLRGRWPRWLWEGSVEARSFRYGPLESRRIRVAGSSRLPSRDGERDLRVEALGASFQGQSLETLDGRWDQDGDSARFDLKATGLAGLESLALTGRLEELWDPSPRLVLNEGRILWNKRPFQVAGKVELSPHEGRFVFAPLNVSRGSEEVEVKGELALKGKNDLRISWSNVAMEKWAKWLSDHPPSLHGILSGRLHLTGTAEKPGLEILATVEKGGISREFSLDRLELEGDYEQGALNLQGRFELPGANSPARLQGRFPLPLSLRPFSLGLSRKGPFSAAVEIQGAPVEMLEPHLPFVREMKGAVDFKGEASGTWASPVVDFEGDWKNGRLLLDDWSHPVENIHLRWEGDHRRLSFSGEGLKLLDGRLDLRGDMEYARVADLVVEADAKDLDIPGIFGVTGRGTGRVRLLEALTKPKLQGRLKLKSARMDLGVLESDLAKNIEIVEAEEEGEELRVEGTRKEGDHFFKKMGMDLKLELPSSGTWVRGKGLDAEIAGSLTLRREYEGPLQFRGTLRALRGEYRFQGKELDIVDGELTFLGQDPPDPNLRISTEKQVRDVLVQARVTGPLSHPRLSFGSIPAMEQVDVVSYLMFGRGAGELGFEESSALQERAAYWLSSRASRVLKGALGDFPLAPDVVELHNTSDGDFIEIGKEVTPDLLVTYEKSLDSDEEDQVRLEYRFNRYLSLQSEFGGKDDSGVDVLFRYDFGE